MTHRATIQVGISGKLFYFFFLFYFCRLKTNIHRHNTIITIVKNVPKEKVERLKNFKYTNRRQR